MSLARENKVRVLPVDLEHNALYQLIDGRDPADIRTYTLTASGGPFRTWPEERIREATPQQAVAHPVWAMGAKISVELGDPDEQGPGTDRGASSLRHGPRIPRCAGASAVVVHALVNLPRWLIYAELGGGRHAPPDRLLPALAGARARARRDARSGERRATDVRARRTGVSPPSVSRCRHSSRDRGRRPS